VALAALTCGLLLPSPASATDATCTVSGSAFADPDRDGQRGTAAARSGDVIYLYDAGGAYVAGATTDAAGSYAFAPVPCGDYTVTYGAQTWWSVRDSLVPTTTGSVLPSRDVTGTARADFGWRPITRSTTPITTYTGAEGLRVESYDDVVRAQELHAAVLRGTVGPEASCVALDVASGFAIGRSTAGS
jgi:hypothetical protein